MDYYKKLQEKYLYDEDTIYYLRKIIPILIRYYGSNVEDIIYSAIMNCEIHVRKSIDENINDYMNKYYNLNKEWNIPSLVVGFYHNQLIKENGIVIPGLSAQDQGRSSCTYRNRKGDFTTSR